MRTHGSWDVRVCDPAYRAELHAHPLYHSPAVTRARMAASRKGTTFEQRARLGAAATLRAIEGIENR